MKSVSVPSLLRSFAPSLISSVLYILSFPNWNFSWLAWFSLVPLFLSLFRSPAPSLTRAFLTGWLAGTIAYTGILYWLVITFQAAHLSIALAFLCLLSLAGYLGLYWGAWSLFLAVTYRSSAPSLPRSFAPLFGAAAWVALEYIRTYLLSGFPWALLADSQVENLPIIQIASIAGVYGVSFLIVLANIAIADAVRFLLSKKTNLRHFWGQSPQMRSLAYWGLSPLVVLFCYLWGLNRLTPALTRAPTPMLKIALLQGSIDQYKKWDQAFVAEIQKAYEDLVAQAASAKPDLIIWPETSVPGYLVQDKPLRSWLEKTIRNSRTNHLIGAPYYENEMAYNSAFSIDREGRIDGAYHKTHLVPIGEVVPWKSFLGRYIRVLNDFGGFTAGTRSPVLAAGGVRVGVNICYEAIFPNLVRQSVRQGAQVIANLTNDGWYMKTAAPYQHWAPNIYRAIENNRWVVRANNTGISGIIDPYGRVRAASPIYKSVMITGTVEARTELTFYTRHGDLLAWVCLCFCAFPLLIYILRL